MNNNLDRAVDRLIAGLATLGAMLAARHEANIGTKFKEAYKAQLDDIEEREKALKQKDYLTVLDARSNFLSAQTIKAKRNLVVLSGVAIFMDVTNSFPTKIAALGISFEKNNENDIIYGILVLLMLLFVSFIINIIIDIAHFRDTYLQYVSVDKITPTNRDLISEIDRWATYKIEKKIQLLFSPLKFLVLHGKGFIYYSRIFLDFVGPLIITTYAIIILYI